MGTKLNPSPFDCYAKLEPNEPYFVIMGRDPMGHQLVSMWVKGAELRLSARNFSEEDAAGQHERAQIAEARQCAESMAEWCRYKGKIPMRWTGVAPVITRAPAKTAITREQVNAVLNKLAFAECEEMLEELARAAGVPE